MYNPLIVITHPLMVTVLMILLYALVCAAVSGYVVLKTIFWNWERAKKPLLEVLPIVVLGHLSLTAVEYIMRHYTTLLT